jgi:4-aminobutyrate aminotransferase / (S)-3-amino-2-methylpropionate transaminase
MLDRLKSLCKQYPNLIMNARGLGTFNSIDGANAAVRDKIIQKLRNLGIQSGPCGDRTLRIRPALIFTQRHAEIFLDRFEKALRSL